MNQNKTAFILVSNIHSAVTANKPICYTTKCVIIVQSNTINGQEFQQLSSIIPPYISGDKAQISDCKYSVPQLTQTITTCIHGI